MIITRGCQAKKKKHQKTPKQNKIKGMPGNYRDMHSLFTQTLIHSLSVQGSNPCSMSTMPFLNRRPHLQIFPGYSRIQAPNFSWAPDPRNLSYYSYQEWHRTQSKFRVQLYNCLSLLEFSSMENKERSRELILFSSLNWENPIE